MNDLRVNTPPITRFGAIHNGDLFCYKDGARDNTYMKISNAHNSRGYNAVYLRNGELYAVDIDREVCRVDQVTITVK